MDLGDYIQDIATTIVSSLSDGEISDLRFDCVLSAELAHAYKPAPAVYQTAAAS